MTKLSPFQNRLNMLRSKSRFNRKVSSPSPSPKRRARYSPEYYRVMSSLGSSKKGSPEYFKLQNELSTFYDTDLLTKIKSSMTKQSSCNESSSDALDNYLNMCDRFISGYEPEAVSQFRSFRSRDRAQACNLCGQMARSI